MKLDTLKQRIKPSIQKKLAWVCLSLFLVLSNSYANDLSPHFFSGKWKLQLQKNVISFTSKNTINQIPFLWKKDIYIAIHWKPYWEYKWFNNKGYILVDHRDWKKLLKFIKWNNYDIVAKKNYDIELNNIQTINNIKNLFIKYEQKEISEELKQKVSFYVGKIENATWKDYKNRYITFVDTKWNKLFLLYVDKDWKKQVIWASKVSTWNPRRWKDYFNTPYIIIDRKESWFYKKDWRALWTDAKGYWDDWRRIFFLWKYFVNIKTREPSLDLKNWYKELHLAFHTTTPWWLTQLWKPMSKWCIRTDIFINKLYDKFNKINEWVFIIWDMDKKITYYLNKNEIEKLVLQSDKKQLKIASNK